MRKYEASRSTGLTGAVPPSPPSRGRRIARRVFITVVVVAQLAMIVVAYDSDHKTFGFQMFPESSRWQADVVRVATSPWALLGIFSLSNRYVSMRGTFWYVIF